MRNEGGIGQHEIKIIVIFLRNSFGVIEIILEEIWVIL